MTKGYHYLNGEYLEKEKCFIHVTDLSIQRSFAVFDYFTFIDKTPHYIDDYLNRFRNSVKRMDMEFHLSNGEVKEIVKELIKKNKTEKGGIKFVYTGGYAANGYDATNPNFLIMHLDFPVVADHHYENGIKLLLEEYVRDFPEAKTTDYFFALSLKNKIKEEEAFDVLFEKDGWISESSRSNFFMIDENDKLCTTKDDILEGITRKKLIESCAGIEEVIVRPIGVDELATAKEAFLTSSVKRVIAIRQIGDFIIGDGKPGKRTLELRARLAAYDKAYLSSAE